MIDLATILGEAVSRGASDVHLKVGSPPVMRVSTRLISMDAPPLTTADTEAAARTILSERLWMQCRRRGEIDTAYLLEGVGRFRSNVFFQRDQVGVVMRHVKTVIPGFRELGLPGVLEKIALAGRGIIIVSGATGSGKSTTLAAMIDCINSRERQHIVTIEDPIEFFHPDKQSIVDQREVGIDTRTFAAALRSVMRQDPDIIMVGEMRDRESFQAALSAADVGCLVLATLHSPDAAQVMLRIVDFFPPVEREQARMQFAASVVAVICQRLMPRADGSGMTPAVEIMLGTPTVRKLIRANSIDKLSAAILDGADDGMQTFNQSMVALVQAGLVTEETALAHATNPEALRMNLQGIYLDESRQILGTD
ncbi:MAG: PilT/PilU family type 4a pilus ATPase [bacterium]|nr:PilT/PilU family type 4a pilus ATPase [bacterium]